MITSNLTQIQYDPHSPNMTSPLIGPLGRDLQTDFEKLHFDYYKVPKGAGNCQRCIFNSRGGEYNIYANGTPECWPLVKDITGSNYEEMKVLNIMITAQKG